jgi:hypothetical protein
VVGDNQSFQVERLEKSLVVRTLVPYATSNLFAYFKSREPQLIILTASEDVEPTFFRKFESVKPVPLRTNLAKGLNSKREVRVLSARFDKLKDFLTVEMKISADSKAPIKPNWNLARLSTGNRAIKALKLWAERQEIQKDSAIKVRFVFSKPNIPRDLAGANVIIPVQGESSPLTVNLGRLQ